MVVIRSPLKNHPLGNPSEPKGWPTRRFYESTRRLSLEVLHALRLVTPKLTKLKLLELTMGEIPEISGVRCVSTGGDGSIFFWQMHINSDIGFLKDL